MAAAPKLSILRGIDDTLVYGEDCLLAVAALLVDHAYHRPETPTRIQKLAEAWEPDSMGRVQVNVRNGGGKYVWDGQHRLGAMKLLGIAQVHCTTFYGWDVQREARAFVEANAGQEKLSCYEVHVASLAGGDFRARAIEQVVREFGFHIDARRSNTRDGKPRATQDYVLAVATLYRIYDRKTCGGAEGLRQVLRILTGAYPGRAQAHMADGDMLHGLHAFLTRVHADPNFREQVLIGHLGTESVTALRNKAQDVMAYSVRSRVDVAIPLLLRDVYNKGLRQERRLAPMYGRA